MSEVSFFYTSLPVFVVSGFSDWRPFCLLLPSFCGDNQELPHVCSDYQAYNWFNACNLVVWLYARDPNGSTSTWLVLSTSNSIYKSVASWLQACNQWIIPISWYWPSSLSRVFLLTIILYQDLMNIHYNSLKTLICNIRYMKYLLGFLWFCLGCFENEFYTLPIVGKYSYERKNYPSVQLLAKTAQSK